jgi:DNA invertase Pin-like site-specific DNA recombinase
MTKAYSYIRMSTDIQLKGDSLRRQLNLSRDYADKNGLELVKNMEDIGVSAFRGKNVNEGALGQFIKLVESNEIETGSYLLVESLDRLSRDKITSALPKFLEMINQGICVVTLLDNQKYTKESINENPGQLLISLTIMVRAHEESETKAKRLSASWENKRKNSDTKIITSKCPSWLVARTDKTGFDVIHSAAETVKKIFQWTISGDGSQVVTRRLNEQRIPTIGRGDTWNISYVKKITKNEAVTGVFEPHKLVEGKRVSSGMKLDNYFPEIISRADFLKAQKSIESRKGKGGRKGTFLSNIFTHLAVCGACGEPLNFLNKGSKSKPKLICRSTHQGSGCKSRPWTYQKFEDSFFQSVNGLDLSTVINNEDSNQLKLLEDQLVLKESEIQGLQLKYDENLKRWTKTDDSIKADIEGQLVIDKADLEIRIIEYSKLETKFEDFNTQHFSSAIDNVALLSEKLSQSKSEEDTFSLRSRIVGQIKKIVGQIDVYTNMKVYPWEVSEGISDGTIPSKLLKKLALKRIRTEAELEQYFGTDHGQRVFVEYERYMCIKFRNGKSAWLKPSDESYLEFTKPNFANES